MCFICACMDVTSYPAENTLHEQTQIGASAACRVEWVASNFLAR